MFNRLLDEAVHGRSARQLIGKVLAGG